MVINCEKCHTKFKLDDSRVTEKGVKVRCTKCKQVFKVYKEEPGTVPSPSDEALTGFALSDFQTESSELFTEKQFVPDEPIPDAPFDSSAISFESDALPISDTQTTLESSPEPLVKGGEVDFSSFDFGDVEPEPVAEEASGLSVDDFAAAPIETQKETPAKAVPQGLDFSDDDMFGAVVQAAPEPTTEKISFDLGEDNFSESMDMGGQESGAKRGTLFSLDTPNEEPFSFGEIDFGDELTSVAVQQINPEDLKPSQESLFAPLAAATTESADDDLKRSFLGEETAEATEELPPLSIASRRKQSPMFGALIAVIALLIISVLGYLGYSSFSVSKSTVASDTGKIVVQGVKAAFVDNDGAGEMLVISGEAVNQYPKPRAALQVEVTVFDAAGQGIVTKTAFAGNPLTEEQLESLSLDKIEAAMANQFGDSLANMEVAHGKSIPFVVVVANLPKGAKNFEVKAAGSMVATGKQ